MISYERIPNEPGTTVSKVARSNRNTAVSSRNLEVTGSQQLLAGTLFLITKCGVACADVTVSNTNTQPGLVSI